MKGPHRKHPQKQPRLFIICEGKTEKGFIEALRQLPPCASQQKRGCEVKNANGGGPRAVLKYALTQWNAHNKNTDQTTQGFVLLDDDYQWPVKEAAAAQSKGLILVRATPCFETFLLRFKNISFPPHATPTWLKQQVELHYGKDPANIDWTRDVPLSPADIATKAHSAELTCLLKALNLLE